MGVYYVYYRGAFRTNNMELFITNHSLLSLGMGRNFVLGGAKICPSFPTLFSTVEVVVVERYKDTHIHTHVSKCDIEPANPNNVS